MPVDGSEDLDLPALSSPVSVSTPGESGSGKDTSTHRGNVGLSLPSTSRDEPVALAETSKKSQSLVHIDRQQIQAVAHSSQADELQGLGVDVYDQDVLEQGVLQQVDRAIQEATQAAAKAEAEKEYESVLDDLRTCTTELKHINKIIEQLTPYIASSKDISRKIESVKRQKENKEKQLKKIKAKQKRLQAILGGDDVQKLEAELLDDVDEEPGPSTLGSMLMPAQETEWEELIRKGHMTPFGTKIPQKPEKKEPRRITLSENSAFDQYLNDQAALAVSRKKTPIKKKKAVALEAGDGEARKSSAVSSRDRKLQKRMRKLQRNALRVHPKARTKREPDLAPTKRKARGGGGDSDSEGSEYVPSDELMDPEEPDRDDEFWVGEDEEYELKPYKRRVEPKQRKAKNLEVDDDEYFPSSSDEDGGDEAGKKGQAKKCKDDGDVEYYKQRIR
ncbi:hypothetical protein JZ751_019861 [Albula glossodonta]|uniref:Uncharacterized protein n=1 Tax=Albula glossodonta TaxID=121402 RepID=A0A8T2NXJ5_9TELE|nr:hypothetical protein JZ751_019861 [Albula glossodonta]